MSRTRTSSSLELLLPLDRDSAAPLHRQLEQALRSAIRAGRLPEGALLPSTRALAGQLATSRGIVVEAFEQLVAEGYLASRPGGATRVARSVAQPERPPIVPAVVQALDELVEPPVAFDFRPGRPDVTEFPRAVWLRALRRSLAAAPSDRLTYQGGRGMPELRVALATYLNRARGTAASPADVVISTGFAQALSLLARTLRARGARRIAFEDPSEPHYWATARSAGLEPVGVPVDGDGIVVDELARSRVDAVVVTAAHQFPTGAVLSPARRAALIAWARDRSAFIVEDDYDAEFRYDREPIGAMHGLCPDRVVYAGSAGKVLAPGLRLGWLLAPPELAGPLMDAKEAADMGSAALDQLAFADVLEHGELDHHLRRMRPIYRRRRDALLAALAHYLPDLRPVGAAAGLHVLAWLPDDLPEPALVDAAAAAGIVTTPLGPRRFSPGPAGLVLGYGTIAERSIEPGIARLAEVAAEVRRAGAGTAA